MTYQVRKRLINGSDFRMRRTAAAFTFNSQTVPGLLRSVLIDCMADDFVHLQSRGEGGIFPSEMCQLLSLIDY